MLALAVCPAVVAERGPATLHQTPAQTHNSVLHAEAQLVLEVWPLDEDRGDRRAADDVELHLRLILQTL